MTEAMLRGAASTRLLLPPMEREAGLKERGQSRDPGQVKLKYVQN